MSRGEVRMAMILVKIGSWDLPFQRCPLRTKLHAKPYLTETGSQPFKDLSLQMRGKGSRK